MPQHGKGARRREGLADSDTDVELFIEVKGKQKGGSSKQKKISTFIVRPPALSASARPSDSAQAGQASPVSRARTSTSSSCHTSTGGRQAAGGQHGARPATSNAGAPELPSKGWQPPVSCMP